MINKASPDNKLCCYFGDDFQKDLKELKLAGGISGVIRDKGKVKETPTETGIPKSTSKDGIKVTYEYNGYTINRLNSKSYEIMKDGKKLQSKNLFIQFICELDKTADKNLLLKRGTRPLGNTFLRLVGINL
jgi:hypothetical protein